MKRLFDYIASKAKRRKAFEKSEEFHFFIENRHFLTRLPQFIHFYDIDMHKIFLAEIEKSDKKIEAFERRIAKNKESLEKKLYLVKKDKKKS